MTDEFESVDRDELFLAIWIEDEDTWGILGEKVEAGPRDTNGVDSVKFKLCKTWDRNRRGKRKNLREKDYSQPLRGSQPPAPITS